MTIICWQTVRLTFMYSIFKLMLATDSHCFNNSLLYPSLVPTILIVVLPLSVIKQSTKNVLMSKNLHLHDMHTNLATFYCLEV